MTDEERGIDPQRNLNRLIRAISVSQRIQKLAQAKINQDAWNEEKRQQEELLEKAKVIRVERIECLLPVHIAILDMASMFLGISLDEVKDGMADSDQHVDLLRSLTAADGRRAVLFTYDLYSHPSRGEC